MIENMGFELYAYNYGTKYTNSEFDFTKKISVLLTHMCMLCVCVCERERVIFYFTYHTRQCNGSYAIFFSLYIHRKVQFVL